MAYSETRNNLKVLDKAAADRAPVMITRQRGEDVVLISASEWVGMEETLHLIALPRNAARLLEAVRGFEAGDHGVDEQGAPLP